MYFPGPLEAQKETLGHRRGFLADGLVPEPLGLIPVSHDSCLRHHRGQHMLIFQPVDIACLRTIRIDLLTPGVIRMCADAVDRDDTGARLSALVGREGVFCNPTPHMTLGRHPRRERGPRREF